MASFELPMDDMIAFRDVESMRSGVASHTFYLVNEVVNTSAESYDPIYNESTDPFGSGANLVTSTSYLPFLGSILSQGEDSELFEGGFHTKKFMTIDIAVSTEAELGVNWLSGLLIMFQGRRFRVTDVDRRGLTQNNRVIIKVDEVT